uniref:Uncharacterized protein n=1 Tax=Knipowitschia caucasica TaxID=637954 RepID=A0AAV2J859_KNICA
MAQSPRIKTIHTSNPTLLHATHPPQSMQNRKEWESSQLSAEDEIKEEHKIVPHPDARAETPHPSPPHAPVLPPPFCPVFTPPRLPLRWILSL